MLNRRLLALPLCVIAMTTLLLASCAPTESPAPVSSTAPARERSEQSQADVVAEAKPQTEVEPAAAPREKVAVVEGPQLVPPANDVREPIAEAKSEGPRQRTVFYRADAGRAEVPPVALTKGHEALCRLKVGDRMPDIEAPRLGQDREPVKLAELFGEKATVVVFWKGDRRMAREQLADLGPDVVEPFGDAGVAVIGIVVEESPESAEAVLHDVGAEFPNLLDRDGKAFAEVGIEKLPRTYLLDPQGKILWFDIEYSLSTRRELHQALRAVVGEPAPGRK